MQKNERHQTAMVYVGRRERLEARRAQVRRRHGDFIATPMTSSRNWVIVKTNPQCELRAIEALLAVGIPAYAPVYRRRLFDPRSQRRILRTTPFLVGYVFAMVDPSHPDFGLLRDCDGVAGTLPMDREQPRITIPDREIEVLRRMEASHWLEQDKAFRARGRRWMKGRGVRVVSEPQVIATGAFEGFLASIVRLEGKSAARVVTKVFGKVEEAVVPLDCLVQAA